MLFLSSEQTGNTASGTGSQAEASNAQEAVTTILKKKKCTYSAEVIPPRNGAETAVILRQISALKAQGVDFISVTKGAGGSLRGGTLPIAQLIKSNYGICSLAHFTCRDFNIEEVENTLMDHHYFGIRNILALRGDPPDGRPDHFQPSAGRHMYAYQLVNQIRDLNEGRYLIRDGYDAKKAGLETRKGQATDFCIGVAAYPEEERGVEYFGLKVDSGAEFGITQMIFDADPYARFLEGIAQAGKAIPVLPGLRIITSKATAERMIAKFGINVPRKFVEELGRFESKEDGRKVGLAFTYELCKRLQAQGAPGIHVFVMSDEQTAGELLQLLR